MADAAVTPRPPFPTFGWLEEPKGETMIERERLWLWYAAERLGQPKKQPPFESMTAGQALELLWQLHPVFTGRSDAIAATPYSADFDAEADAALEALAVTDSFDRWEAISAGAWRVLYERHVYAATVLTASMVRNTGFTEHLPVGLDGKAQGRALFLKLLLGPARTIDRQLLPRSKPEALPAFPADMTLRRQ